MKVTITEYSLTTTWTATSRRKELYTWYCVWVENTHNTNDNVTTKTQSTFHTKHMNIDTWSECARGSLICFVSQVLLVLIAHHIVAQVSLVRVISWSSHDERISSTLSPPFLSTSSSSQSSLISCTSPCTSSTTWRAVVTLRTSPERRWTPLTTPTSSHFSQKGPRDQKPATDLTGTMFVNYSKKSELWSL